LEVINGKFFIEGYEFKTEPWKHQRTGFLLIKFLKSIMLNWDMRTGKTFTVANAMQYFSRCTDLKKTLVLAPSGIMESTWIRDVYKHTDLEGYAATQKSNKQRLISLDRGNITMPMDNGRYKEFSGTPDYFVLNHDSISNEGVLEYILNVMQPDNLVIDEYHLFKTPNANRTKAALKLSKYIHEIKNGSVIAMSGTPVARDLRDTYAPSCMIDKKIFNYTYTEFKRQFCIISGGYQDGTDGFEKYHGEKNKDRFRSRYLVRSQRVLIQDCHDMPEKIETIKYIDMTPEQSKHHKDLKDKLTMELPKDKGILNVTSLTKLQKLVQITGGYVYDTEKDVLLLKKNPKLEELDNLLEQILSNPKNNVVLLTNYKPPMKIIREYLKTKPWGFHELTTESSEDRSLAVWDFQHEPNARIMFASPALCPGNDMSKANYVIFYDNTYEFVDRDQGESRIFTHTSIEHGTVVTIDLICRGSIDENIHKILMKKRDLNQEMTAEDLIEFLK
jgi:SNF2 family DNA or RNA helicase